MKMTISRISLVAGAILIVMGTMHSCMITSKAKAVKKNTEASGAIPSDFGKEGGTLLLIKNRDIDPCIKRQFGKYYHGKTKFIDLSELKNEGYNDLKEYRYYFYFEFKDAPNRTEGLHRNVQFYIYDRADEKTYKQPTSKKDFAVISPGKYIIANVRAYAINLEQARLKKS